MQLIKHQFHLVLQQKELYKYLKLFHNYLLNTILKYLLYRLGNQ
jgi:hypothetical protein